MEKVIKFQKSTKKTQVKWHGLAIPVFEMKCVYSRDLAANEIKQGKLIFIEKQTAWNQSTSREKRSWK